MAANSNFFDFSDAVLPPVNKTEQPIAMLLYAISCELAASEKSVDSIGEVVSSLLNRKEFEASDLVELQQIDLLKQTIAELTIVLELLSTVEELDKVTIAASSLNMLRLQGLKSRLLT